jgi:hypothetical protein
MRFWVCDGTTLACDEHSPTTLQHNVKRRTAVLKSMPRPRWMEVEKCSGTSAGRAQQPDSP